MQVFFFFEILLRGQKLSIENLWGGRGGNNPSINSNAGTKSCKGGGKYLSPFAPLPSQVPNEALVTCLATMAYVYEA